MVGTFLKEYFITARISKSLGEFSKILDHRHSLTEAPTEKGSLKTPVRSVTHKLCYL